MKALILTGKLATDQEVFYPLYRMDEEGWGVDIAVRGGKEVLGEKGIRIVPTRDIDDSLYGESYDLLILPGGAKCMEYMRQDQEILRYISAFTKVIGSICHGAQLLISSNRVRGHRISGYYSIKDDIRNAGGTFVDAPFVTSGKIVSSPHYKYLGPWMKEVIRVTQIQPQPRGVGEGDFGVE
jgi:protease I